MVAPHRALPLLLSLLGRTARLGMSAWFETSHQLGEALLSTPSLQIMSARRAIAASPLIVKISLSHMLHACVAPLLDIYCSRSLYYHKC